MSSFWFWLAYCLINIVLCLAVKGLLACLNPKWSEEDKIIIYVFLLLNFITLASAFIYGKLDFKEEINLQPLIWLYIPMLILDTELLNFKKAGEI